MPYWTNRTPFPAESDQRVKILLAAAIAGFLILLLRLFQLQILKGPEMYRLAEKNRTQIIPLTAPRGLVLDRHGEVLLDNAPNFSLFYSHPPAATSELSHEKELIKWFPGSEGLLRRKMKEARQTGKMTRVISGMARPVALALLEKKITLPGIDVVVEPQRHARFGPLASHLLGYVDEISPAELERLKAQGHRMRMGQLIGRTGVERFYDSFLRGEDGGRQLEMDAAGRHVHELQRIPSKPGANVVLTIDRRLQEAVEKGLRESPTKRGAAVVMDPRNGGVLALASLPDFDPSADFSQYLGDPGLPFFNRALQGTYPPGSIFKIVTAAAALEDAGWDIRQTYFCNGLFELGSREFGCWSRHNRRDFHGAMAWSCNIYFYNMGLRVGPDAIERYARAFSFGEKTGIDLPSESSGLIPGREWKMKAHKTYWYDGDTVNFSIGQGAVSVTPLQAAVMFSAAANGGVLNRPYVVQQVISPEGQVLYQPQPSARTVKLSPKVWNTIHQAMEDVVTTGTGHGVFRPDLVMGAKTGTAQNPHGKDHSWFGAYAGLPGQRPSLVVVVFVEHGGHGSAAAGPVARMAINTAFPPAAAGQKGHQATSPGLPLPSPAIPVVPSGSRP